MYVTIKQNNLTTPLKTSKIQKKLYLQAEDIFEFKRLTKQQKLDMSSLWMDILSNLKRKDKIFLGGIQSIILMPYNNTIFIKSNKQNSYKIENINFQENYIMENINKYYDLNKPILFKGKKFYKLFPVYAVIFALKENINFDTTILQNFIKSSNIKKDEMIKELSNLVRDEIQRKKIQKIVDLLYTDDIFKIKLKYSNADVVRFDKLNTLLQYLFSYNNITQSLDDYLLLDFSKEINNNNYYFWEAYFSNYIEGTKFEIEEAEKIVKEEKEYYGREEDSHHILNYYKTIKKLYPQIHKKTKFLKFILDKEGDNLVEYLKKIHKSILKHTNIAGHIKQGNNMVGSYLFVFPEKVVDTFKMSVDLFNYYLRKKGKIKTKDLAIIMFIYFHFVITEIHPFIDGNGRTTRILTNLLLISADLFPVIITDRMRENYTGALKYMGEIKTDIYVDKMIAILNYQKNMDYSCIKNNETMKNQIIETKGGFFDVFDEMI